jgi:peptidoglycan biosynthesis protein MviN/MurJ (putative lipid II flippase)
VANVVMTGLLYNRLRVGFNGRLEGAHTLMVTARIVAASAAMAALAWIIWSVLDSLLGHSLIAEIVAVGFAIAAATALYARIVLAMRIPEARQIESLIRERLRR